MVRLVLLLALALSLLGCGRSLPNSTPEGAVREFVEQLSVFEGRPSDADALFELLSERGKQNLRTRAERYGAASGRQISPSAMLVASRVVPAFVPRTYLARLSGDEAVVEIRGVTPTERAELPCVREQGAWRVDLTLPDLPPMRVRPGAAP